MSTDAIIFMAITWAIVLGVTAWAFSRVLRSQRHFDPDGIGPREPPVPGRAEQEPPPPAPPTR